MEYKQILKRLYTGDYAQKDELLYKININNEVCHLELKYNLTFKNICKLVWNQQINRYGENETLAIMAKNFADYIVPYLPEHGTLYISGHGIAGGIALLLSKYVTQDCLLKIHVFTFGAPRVGNHVFWDRMVHYNVRTYNYYIFEIKDNVKKPDTMYYFPSNYYGNYYDNRNMIMIFKKGCTDNAGYFIIDDDVFTDSIIHSICNRRIFSIIGNAYSLDEYVNRV